MIKSYQHKTERRAVFFDIYEGSHIIERRFHRGECILTREISGGRYESLVKQLLNTNYELKFIAGGHQP